MKRLLSALGVGARPAGRARATPGGPTPGGPPAGPTAGRAGKGSASGKVARGAAINLAGEMLSAITPLYYVVIARLLGAETLGAWLVAMASVTLAVRLSVGGFEKAMLRYVPLGRAPGAPPEALATAMGTAFRWAFMVALATLPVLVVYTWVAGRADGRLLDWIPWLTLAIPIEVMAMVALYALRGAERMWPFVLIRQVLMPTLLIGGSMGLIIGGVGPNALLIAYLASVVVGLTFALYALRRTFPALTPAVLVGTPRDRKLLSFAWPQGLTAMLNYMLARVDILMIAAFFPDEPALVAAYGTAAEVSGVVKKVRLAIDQSLSPAMSTLVALGDHVGIRVLYAEAASWTIVAYLAVAGLLSAGSPLLLSAFGPEFVQWWPVIPILCLGRLFNAVAGPAQVALLMHGHSRTELSNILVINIANAVFNLVLIPLFAVMGAASATSLALASFNLVRIRQVRKILGLYVPFKVLARPLGAGLMALTPVGLALAFVPDAQTAGGIGVLSFVVAYPVSLWLCGALPKKPGTQRPSQETMTVSA